MPFKSEAQRRKFGELLKEGKITQAAFDEYAADTPHGLPDKVGPTKKKVASLLRRGKAKG